MCGACIRCFTRTHSCSPHPYPPPTHTHLKAFTHTRHPLPPCPFPPHTDATAHHPTNCKETPTMCNFILLALLVAVVAIMWQGFPMLFGPSGPNYSTASTADNQDLLKHLGKVQDGDPITKWLARPPGARYAIGKPDKEEGAVPIIKLGWLCSAICTKTKFPVVVDNKCAACLTLFSLPTWSHDENGKPNPPLARLPVYESGMPALAAIPLLYPRRWASADLLQVRFQCKLPSAWLVACSGAHLSK